MNIIKRIIVMTINGQYQNKTQDFAGSTELYVGLESSPSVYACVSQGRVFQQLF